jgi:hypothetical protein
MKKLEKQTAFIHLLLRSPDTGGGWRTVSKALEKLATASVEDNPELFEVETTDGGMRIRLSERGLVVADYI